MLTWEKALIGIVAVFWMTKFNWFEVAINYKYLLNGSNRRQTMWFELCYFLTANIYRKLRTWTYKPPGSQWNIKEVCFSKRVFHLTSRLTKLKFNLTSHVKFEKRNRISNWPIFNLLQYLFSFKKNVKFSQFRRIIDYYFLWG